MTEQNKEKANYDEAKEKEREEVLTEVIDADNQVERDQYDSNESETNSHVVEIDQLKKEKDEMHQSLLRVQAEFDNFKKRSQKEKEANRKYKAEDVVKELLPAIDNFERALEVEATDETKSFIDGVSMVYNQIKDALKSQGVEEIETVGQPFDPNIHHAVMQVEDEKTESDTVTEELQKGYYLKDRVIRPAMVKVSK